MAFNKQLIIIISVLFSLTACTGGGSDDPNPTPQPPLAEKRPIHISPTLQSRATESNFEIGDYIGLYIVNHPSNGSVAKLQTSGNHVDNMKFTYNGTWTAASPIYWKDNVTHADFYLYYPYTTSIGDVNAIPWSVNAAQSTSEKYKAGDLLIGKTTDVTPTESDVGIAARHMMSQMVISLQPGNGFTNESLNKSKISVKINQLKIQAIANLATGEISAKGDAADLTPLKEEGNNYKALIIPQAVGEGILITVNVDGRDYNLQKASNFTAFEAGKKHKFTVTLSKTSNGVNVNITKWEDDGIDYGGTAE